MEEFTKFIKCMKCGVCRLPEDPRCECQDEIQEDATSMEEKLEALEEISACCGAPYSSNRFCASCREHC